MAQAADGGFDDDANGWADGSDCDNGGANQRQMWRLQPLCESSTAKVEASGRFWAFFEVDFIVGVDVVQNTTSFPPPLLLCHKALLGPGVDSLERLTRGLFLSGLFCLVLVFCLSRQEKKLIHIVCLFILDWLIRREMGKKRRAEETQAKTKAKVSKKDTKKKVKKEEVDSDSDEGNSVYVCRVCTG